MWGDGPPRRSSGIRPHQWVILVLLVLLGLFGVYMAGKTSGKTHPPRHPAPSVSAR